MRILILHNVAGAYSETFIRNHIVRLPGEVEALHGQDLDLHYADGRALAPRTLARRLFQAVAGRLLRKDYRFFRKLAFAAYLRRTGTEVVLAEYGPNGVVAAGACRRCEVPLVVHFHGYDAYLHSVLSGETGKEYPALFRQAAAVIGVSRDMVAQLISLGAPEAKVRYVPYGVDCELFHVAPVATNPPVFVGVGRFTDKKAPYLTVLAFSRCLAKVPEARLVMIGDGPLLETCRRLAVALGCNDQVEFRGVCTSGQVAEAMQTARAFVQHSLRPQIGPAAGDSEGTPLAVLESGASGLPVIATRHAGIADVIVDGETGFLVAEGDIEGMAAAMVKVAAEPELAAQFGQRARRRIEQDFEVDKQIGKLNAVLAEAAGTDGERTT